MSDSNLAATEAVVEPPVREATRMRTAAEMRRQSAKKNRNGLAYVFLSIGGFVMVFPFLFQLIMSLSSYSEITSSPPSLWPDVLMFENYAKALAVFPVLNQMGTTIVITVIRVAAHIVLCSLAGYAFARLKFPAAAAIFAIVLSILMVPGQVYLLPQYEIIQGLGLLDTIPGLVMPGMFSAFGIFLMTQAFKGIPREMEEAARLDGAGPVKTFGLVMFPLVAPSLSALAITSTLWSWNELLWPLVMMSNPNRMPLSVGLATLQGSLFTDYGPLMAASLLAMAPILILFIAMQKRVINGLASSGLK